MEKKETRNAMKRALSDSQVKELRRTAGAMTAEGAYGAICSSDYPTLKSLSPDCGGAQLTREWTQEQSTKAEDEFALNPTYANQCRIACLKMLLPLFIDEIETVQ